MMFRQDFLLSQWHSNFHVEAVELEMDVVNLENIETLHIPLYVYLMIFLVGRFYLSQFGRLED